MNISFLEYFNKMFKEAFSDPYFSTIVYIFLFVNAILIFRNLFFADKQADKTIEENNLKLNLKKTKEDNLETFKDNFLEKAS